MTLDAPPTPAADDDLPLPCPNCGYDLRGGSAGVCPECGGAFDAAELARSAGIPWQDRGRLGRTRAFVRTVRLAVRHPTTLARAAVRPVDYAAARRFQLWCVALAGATFGVPLAVAGWIGLRGAVGFAVTFGPPPHPLLGQLADGVVLLAAVVGLFLWLLTATGVASYFFHPKGRPVELQNRAVALSYYAAAPLALAPIAGVLLLAVIGTGVLFDQRGITFAREPGLFIVTAMATLAAGSTCLLILVDLIVLPLVLLARGLHASVGRLCLCGVTLAVAWPLLFLVFAVGLPALAFYAQLAWHALR